MCSVFIFLFSVIESPLLADAPPAWDGNSGVPSLLAKIEALETELSETKEELTIRLGELAGTQEELIAKQGELDVEKQVYRVPQTGQDQCWTYNTLEPTDPHLVEAVCSIGQDGEKQAGLAPPSLNRFVDNQDGTITDTFTNLVWLKDAGCLNNLTWEVAVSQGTKLPQEFLGVWLCNLNDGTTNQGLWRLPNINELMSLLDFRSTAVSSNNGQALPKGHPFTGFGGFYWTSTTYALDPNLSIEGLIHPCIREGYGHNWDRFNDAYIVNVDSGELIHAPKAIPGEILTRHGEENSGLGACSSEGFANGSPGDNPNYMPQPGFIVVRDNI